MPEQPMHEPGSVESALNPQSTNESGELQALFDKAQQEQAAQSVEVSLPEAGQTVQLPGSEGSLANWTVVGTNPDKNEFWAKHTDRQNVDHMRTFTLGELATAQKVEDDQRALSMPRGSISDILDNSPKS